MKRWILLLATLLGLTACGTPAPNTTPMTANAGYDMSGSGSRDSMSMRY